MLLPQATGLYCRLAQMAVPAAATPRAVTLPSTTRADAPPSPPSTIKVIVLSSHRPPSTQKSSSARSTNKTNSNTLSKKQPATANASSSPELAPRAITTAQASSLMQCLVCDVPNPAQATLVTYSGYGFLYNGTPLAPAGSTGVLAVNGSRTGGAALQVAPANITSDGIYSIAVGSPCRVDSAASYLYCPPGAPQNDTGEQFLVVSSGANSISAGQPLGPGSAIFLKSLQTGKYCRVVSVQGKQQIVCDVEDPQAPGAAGASVFDYTGSGFSYNGQGFANYGGDEPLQLEEGGVPAGVAPGGCMAVLGLTAWCLLAVCCSLPCCVLQLNTQMAQGDLWIGPHSAMLTVHVAASR
jgi:hypothetical protein